MRPHHALLRDAFLIETGQRCWSQRDRLKTVPEVAQTPYVDGFGNVCTRLIAPVGTFVLKSDGMIFDDGSEDEPVLLPASVPNLLCNGAAGIAVGMATSIPPHNLDDVCAALLHLLKFPNATIAKLVELVPGPDFPTGGVLVEDRDSVAEAYATGRGSFRLRAKWEGEKLGHGQYQVVITEIPYQVQKSRIVEKIADLLNAKKLALLGDVRDESAEDIRLILEPRNRSIEPDVLMEQMFRMTDLETRASLNMNVLDSNTVPRVMNLRDVLRSFLEHRETLLVRRTKHRLAKIEHRLEVLSTTSHGVLVAATQLLNDQMRRLHFDGDGLEDRPQVREDFEHGMRSPVQ